MAQQLVGDSRQGSCQLVEVVGWGAAGMALGSWWGRWLDGKAGPARGAAGRGCIVWPYVTVWAFGGENNRVRVWAASRAENGVKVGRRGVRQQLQGGGHMSIRVSC